MIHCLQLIPLLIDGLTILSEDVQNRDIVYNLLLVLSGILTDKNGETCYLFLIKPILYDDAKSLIWIYMQVKKL